MSYKWVVIIVIVLFVIVSLISLGLGVNVSRFRLIGIIFNLWFLIIDIMFGILIVVKIIFELIGKFMIVRKIFNVVFMEKVVSYCLDLLNNVLSLFWSCFRFCEVLWVVEYLKVVRMFFYVVFKIK